MRAQRELNASSTQAQRELNGSSTRTQRELNASPTRTQRKPNECPRKPNASFRTPHAHPVILHSARAHVLRRHASSEITPPSSQGKADMDTVNEVLVTMREAPARFAESRAMADQMKRTVAVSKSRR